MVAYPLIPEAGSPEISDFAGEARYPGSMAKGRDCAIWIPAFAGMIGEEIIPKTRTFILRSPKFPSSFVTSLRDPQDEGNFGRLEGWAIERGGECHER